MRATFDPVGSTATLVIERFRQSGMEPSRPSAVMLLGAVLSDTVILNSPTTTERDHAVIAYLEQALAIDATRFGREMFEHTSDLERVPAEEIVKRDAKDYEAGGHSMRIAQVETVGKDLGDRRDELVKALDDVREREGHALVALMVTDILAKGSKLYVSGRAAADRARVRQAGERRDRPAGRDEPQEAGRAKAAQGAQRLMLVFAQQVVETLGGSSHPDTVLARQMQAMSLTVHIPIVCFGIAFPAMFVFVEGLYLRTGNLTYKALAKRWSKVALILFAVGVVTGTILSFEFGLLWPNFMATFGDVFGIAFGLEGISFFVEAIFIAIYVYGWDRLSPRAHFLSGIPVVIAGFTGSFNVIAVNGWMNTPDGFQVVDGKVVNPQPWDALFNAGMWHELIHMYLAGYLVCGFIVAGVYAYAWMRGKRDHYHRTALVVTLAFASLAAPVQVIVGDWAGRSVAENQPVKLAAFEGLQETTAGAPFTFGGLVEIPKMLSILAFHDPNAVVKGLDTVPPGDRPPVTIVRVAFQTMVSIGTGLALLGVVFFFTWLRLHRLPRSKWFYRAVMVAGPLSFVALIAGWIVTEVGRQPWIVYEVMRTTQAVTAVDYLEVGYVFLVLVYLGLGAAVVWLLRRLTRKPATSEVQ